MNQRYPSTEAYGLPFDFSLRYRRWVAYTVAHRSSGRPVARFLSIHGWQEIPFLTWSF